MFKILQNQSLRKIRKEADMYETGRRWRDEENGRKWDESGESECLSQSPTTLGWGTPLPFLVTAVILVTEQPHTAHQGAESPVGGGPATASGKHLQKLKESHP